MTPTLRRFAGRVAVVTGAGSGLGKGIALRLAEEGAHVIVADIDRDGGRATVAQIGHATFIRCDVTRADDVAALAEATQTIGPVTVLVNNAGATPFGALHELDESAWDGTIDLCLKSVYLCSRALLPQMMSARHGAIVNIASVNQRAAFPGLPAYTAAKGAMVALTRQMAVEYGPHGIHCNVVSPGWIRTPATESRLQGPPDEEALLECHPVGRLGTPEDVAAAVAFLASDEARFISGAELVVDGACSLVNPQALLRPGFRRRSGLPPLQRL